ncbi:MAG: cell division protein FtsL [Candidatus Eutrophobiaceae bacterium]
MNRAIAILLVLALAFSLVAIYVRHQVRVANVELQRLWKQQDELLLEWGRISLELSSLANYDLIEHRAREELGLRLVHKEEMVVLER